MKDVLVSLTEAHMRLGDLAHSVRTSADRLPLFDDLSKALQGHFAALEQVIVPAFTRAGSPAPGAGVLDAHRNLQHRLAELLSKERGAAGFDAELTAFCDEVDAHADREQLELLPVMRERFGEAERATLAEQVEARIGR